jgi:hypothetical protein
MFIEQFGTSLPCLFDGFRRSSNKLQDRDEVVPILTGSGKATAIANVRDEHLPYQDQETYKVGVRDIEDWDSSILLKQVLMHSDRAAPVRLPRVPSHHFSDERAGRGSLFHELGDGLDRSRFVLGLDRSIATALIVGLIARHRDGDKDSADRTDCLYPHRPLIRLQPRVNAPCDTRRSCRASTSQSLPPSLHKNLLLLVSVEDSGEHAHEVRAPGARQSVQRNLMSRLPFLSDEEIAEICAPLVMPAYQIKYLAKLGLVVRRKPNGRPLVARGEFERVLIGHQPERGQNAASG